MVQQAAHICLFILIGCLGLTLYRVIKGPTMADRVMGAENIFILMIGIIVLQSIFMKSSHYFDLVLVFSLLGFVGTICFEKFLARGRIIE